MARRALALAPPFSLRRGSGQMWRRSPLRRKFTLSFVARSRRAGRRLAPVVEWFLTSFIFRSCNWFTLVKWRRRRPLIVASDTHLYCPPLKDNKEADVTKKIIWTTTGRVPTVAGAAHIPNVSNTSYALPPPDGRRMSPTSAFRVAGPPIEEDKRGNTTGPSAGISPSSRR